MLAGRLIDVLARLKSHYSGFTWESEIWPGVGHNRSPYRALVLFALSPRTKDRLLVEMCQRFFRRFPDPESLGADSIGYKNEAAQFVRKGQAHFVKSLSDSSRSWERLPRDGGQLMEISGVGEKVSECVKAYGWGDAALPVDANVCRVLERIDGEKSGAYGRDANQVRQRLKCTYMAGSSDFEKESIAMIDVHEILRVHGQVCCTRKPECEACPLLECRFRAAVFDQGRRPVFNEQMWDDWRELLLEPAPSISFKS